MMIDHANNTYRPDGNSADFHRCAEGWRLWSIHQNADPAIAFHAWVDYKVHVKNCQECIAMRGRFAEE